MILKIDTTDKDFIVTRRPTEKRDHAGQPRKSKDGETQWVTQVVVTDESGGEIISVNTNGRPGDLDVGDPVEVSGLVAIPWNANSRNGVAYRATSIKLAD
jgi:hypothetical protein